MSLALLTIANITVLDALLIITFEHIFGTIPRGTIQF